MEICFGWSWKVMEKSWKLIFLKEWSPCNAAAAVTCYVTSFLTLL